MVTADGWQPLSLSSTLHQSPHLPTPAPVLGKLDSLPFDKLPWEDFEKIQWRIMRDVEGLRHAQLYGDRGQKQQGLDVVALSPDGRGVALQSKRYVRFGPAELKAAVKKFQDALRPFAVDRLIIGVSRDVKSTKVVQTLADLRRTLRPLTLDFWDKQELSRLLRNSPEIVIEFFGIETAQAFCLPFTLQPISVPPRNAVAIREALARTPEVTTGAADLFSQAEALVDDPAGALELIEKGQTLLREARFDAHAMQYEADRSKALARLGRADEAARQILDNLWQHLDRGAATSAQITRRQLEELSRDSADNTRVSELAKAGGLAIDLYVNPLAYLPEPTTVAIGDLTDRVRLAVLAGEIALSDDNQGWIIAALPSLSALAAATGTDLAMRTRLRLLIAEATGQWSQILADARKLQLGHGWLGLITARYARDRAINQQFEEADALWEEATGDASLAELWTEAATWVFSRRAFRTRWKPFTSDQLLPLQTALREMGPSRPLIVVDDDAYQEALENLRTHKLRPAAIAAQRALRDAIVTSDWVAEERARRIFAAILIESDEPERAAHHLARAGDTADIKELGETLPQRFIDVSKDLTGPNYWTVGTSYLLIAKQADLVPDATIGLLAQHIIQEIEGAEAGTLPDLRAFASSRYQGALKALGGIAHRLSPEQAEVVLAHFERQPPVSNNHYRYHDDDEADAVARIALSQPSLRARAMRHLVTLLARSQSARGNVTLQAVSYHFDTVRDQLYELAASGNQWGSEMLAIEQTEDVAPAVAEDALQRLTTPLTHTPGVFSIGTGAAGDALLASSLPAERLDPAMAELLERADDPRVGTIDRGDYLVAAATLALQIDETARSKYFEAAMRIVDSPSPSEHDEHTSQFRHPLGGVRIVEPSYDVRGRAVLLAARLATEVPQRDRVKDQAFALMGSGDGSDYWPTRALQRLGDDLKDDVGLMAGQGWALRCLAAAIWVTHGSPPMVGLRLAEDPDVRVRKALATSLGTSPVQDFQTAVRAKLANDPSYEVRASLPNRDDAATSEPESTASPSGSP